MGFFGSDNSQENNGQIQNSIAINDTVNTYGNGLSILLGIIAAIKVIELIVFLQKAFCRSVKRRLNDRQSPNTQA